MICALCRTRFWRLGFGCEPEPCDCGACLTGADLRELTPEEYDRLTAPDEPEPDPDGPVDE